MPVPRKPTAYRITSQLVADHIGAGVMCLAAQGLGRAFRLHARRPGPDLNARPFRLADGIAWRTGAPDGSSVVGAGGRVEIEPVSPLVLVRIDGALEQRAGYYDQPNGCQGWSDGHDAVAERLISAFEEGDVLLVVDSPGGAAAGLQQAVIRAQAAKVKHGRRCTIFDDEMEGSACAWWGFALADERVLPPAAMVGSIGARGEHLDISGLMAREGLKKTYFADPPDKIAFAPEFPLSPAGEMRGNRDVKLAAGAFRAAVCAGPVGQRYGLTPEFLIELGADMLTGQAAVDAGLADGVASFDEVVAYALQLASESASTRTAKVRARAQAPRRARA